MYSSRNPFLEMLAAIGDEDEAQQKPSGSSLQQQQQQRPGKVQLDKFWPQAPNAWFATAELKLKVANITGEGESALPMPSVPWVSACFVLLWTSWSTRSC